MRSYHRVRYGRKRGLDINERCYALWTLRNGDPVLVDCRYTPIAGRKPGRLGYTIEWRYFGDELAVEQWLDDIKRNTSKRNVREWSEEVYRAFMAGEDICRFGKLHPVKSYTWDQRGY